MDHNNNLPSRTQYQRSLRRKKQHFYQKWWFWTIIVLVLLAGGGVTAMKLTATGPFHTTTKVAKSTKSSQNKSKQTKVNKSGVTFAQYSGIYLNEAQGTPVETVERLLGKADSTSTSNANNTKIQTKTWNKIQNGGNGSNLKVNFIHGRAVSKVLNGLKVTRDKKLGLDAYMSIQNGMPESTILNNLGKPNSYSESLNNNQLSKSYTYSTGISGKTGAQFTVKFTDDKVSGKTQSELQ
ncbi:DUF3862 domain-containing protein [Companilactobacillus sp. FL22-1]|uniref:DUF3862 domain-containing protein n=1 Tax=Companilactobacillus sp. FL22-1 TaxID=3373892 RepID=UPI003754DE76